VAADQDSRRPATARPAAGGGAAPTRACGAYGAACARGTAERPGRRYGIPQDVGQRWTWCSARACFVTGRDNTILNVDLPTLARDLEASAAGRWVGVCGGMASDPQAVPLLVGLGVDELSVGIPAIPSVKAEIRRLSLSTCAELAARALDLDSAASVRELVPLDDDQT
jgi:hypothetical protein